MVSLANMLEIIEFSQPEELKELPLQERAVRAKVTGSRQFVSLHDKKEVGYLSFDEHMEIKTGVLYEVFVLPQFRQQGIGSRLVIFGEDFARSIGCQRVRLSPRAFDQSVTQSWLESWYGKRGYCIAQDGSQEFEKYFE